MKWIDSAAIHDESTMDSLRYLGGTRPYGRYALSTGTQDWSGPLPVLVSPGREDPTLLKVVFPDEE